MVITNFQIYYLYVKYYASKIYEIIKLYTILAKNKTVIYFVNKITKRKAKKNGKTFNQNSEIIDLHVNKNLLNLGKLLNETYHMIYSRDILVLISSNITSISYDDPMFISIVKSFLEQFKVVTGRTVYQSLVEIWNEEDLLNEYIISWLYSRIMLDLSTNMKTKINIEG